MYHCCKRETSQHCWWSSGPRKISILGCSQYPPLIIPDKHHQHKKTYKILVNKASQEGDRLSSFSLPLSLSVCAGKFSSEPRFTALIMNFSPSSHSGNILVGEMGNGTWRAQRGVQLCLCLIVLVLVLHWNDFMWRDFISPPAYWWWQGKENGKKGSLNLSFTVLSNKPAKISLSSKD